MNAFHQLSIIALAALAHACTVREVQEEQLVVCIQPLGDVSMAVQDSVRSAVHFQHGTRVHIAAPLDMPQHAFTEVRAPRYRADTLIAWLRRIKPDSVDIIVGLTDKDISITKYEVSGSIKEPVSRYRDFGVFGLGYLGGPSCVVSTYRLGQGGAFFGRLAKIAVHEVGHTRNLAHCSDTLCVMRDAVERMSTIDGAGRGLCARCWERTR